MVSFFLEHQSVVIGSFLILLVLVINFIYAKLNGLYQYASKHVPAYSLIAVLIIAFLFFLHPLSSLESTETVMDVIVEAISNYVTVIAFALVYFLERSIKNHSEDRQRLREDYFALAEKYCKEPLVSASGHLFPVSVVGAGDIPLLPRTAQTSEAIAIRDTTSEYVLPGIIEQNFFKMLQAYDTSTKYNNLNIRVVDFSFRENRLELVTQRTRYYYSLVTNRAADYEWEQSGITVRNLYETGPRLQSLRDSPLSNHLGFNGFVVSCDGCVPFVKRSEKLSIGKRTYGTSIGASMKTKYALDGDGCFTTDGLIDSILFEIRDELKIKSSELESVRLICAYRDCVECGKPQLLFYARTKLDARAVTMRFYGLGEDSNDGDSAEKASGHMDRERKQELSVIADGKKLVWLGLDRLPSLSYEEKGIRCAGAESGDPKTGFFEFTSLRGAPTGAADFLPMVPSASASVVFLTDYLDRRSEQEKAP